MGNHQEQQVEIDADLELSTTALTVIDGDSDPVAHAVMVAPGVWHVGIGYVSPASWDNETRNVAVISSDRREDVEMALYLASRAVRSYQEEVADAEERLATQIADIPSKL